MTVRERVRAVLPERVRRPLRAARRVTRFARIALLDPKLVPDLFHVFLDLYRHPDAQRLPGGWQYRGRFYPDYLTVGGASHAIFGRAAEYCRGRGIDIGAGLWPLPGAIPVDVWRGPGAGTVLSDFDARSLDYVFSSHCLEHIPDWKSALSTWVSKVGPGGTVFLYLPHPDCEIWHRNSPFIGDAHAWIPTLDVVVEALRELDCSIVEVDEGPDSMQGFFVCARRNGAAREPL